MSDYLSITCSCGCDNRMPVDCRGKIERCVACGNDLPIPTDAVTRTNSSAPKVSMNVPPATLQAGFIKPSARSPFEEDPTEGLVPGLTGRFTNYAPPVHEQIDESCTRCGRNLRDEWDRLETSAGVLCYVCANQVADGVPERLKHIAAAEEAERARPPSERVLDSVEYSLPPWWAQYRSPAVKLAVLAMVGL